MRFEKLIESLLKEGLVWKDCKSVKNKTLYFFPSMMNDFEADYKNFNPLMWNKNSI